VAFGFVGLQLLCVIATADTCPVSQLPLPTGNFAVGSTVLSPETFPFRRKPSQLRVQLWYPAAHEVKGTTTSYVPAATLKLMREQKYYDQPDCVYDAWSKMSTHAHPGVPAATQRRFPLIIFLPGQGVSRSNYTSFAEQFASDGYVVATFDFVHGGFMLPLDDTADAGSEADAVVVVEEWASDVSGFLDKLFDPKSTYQLPRNLQSQIDHTKVAAIGHSIGGAAALQVCQTDPRVRACVDMDGTAFGDVAQNGLRTGALILLSHVEHSDEELKARGRTREQWDAMGKQRTSEWQKVLAPVGGAIWVMKVQGTGHFTYSDGPFTMPSTITRFGGVLIDPKRGFAVIVGTVEAYLKSVFARNVHDFNPTQYSETTILLTRGGKD
jgi:dienelactone hydrolase